MTSDSKKPKLIHITVCVDRDIHRRILERCDEEVLPMSILLRRLLTKEFQEQTKEKRR